ncbi:diaminopimelate dehydrogenase [Sulfuritortus calidifontis]|uniref:Diaminopimelate dehydrogenase n=1 Tax=Sulfuritortus calidifontis TaxID=1914471 RepID=A0A4R3JS41_9PROT|nr:Gfo/Idh/MocA family oxidoreductase [Sulfuritortus calidifontis]TCS69990.1 diaminopimelate dehydrogenase [Sulfuritortus calidifontis]
MQRIRLAVVGFGRLGRACIDALREAPDLELAGVVRRPEQARHALPQPYARVKVADHVSALGAVDGALVCVPPEAMLDVAQELLRHKVPVVECAAVDEATLHHNLEALHAVAVDKKVPAILGAGWSPGALSLFQNLFQLLIPKGETELNHRPGVSLHHSAAAREIKGVRDALCAELRGADGRPQRYVYVELQPGADLDAVTRAVVSDPLFLGEETQVFVVDRVAELEQAGHGVVLSRRGTAGRGIHDSLLLEGRFDPYAFSARIMLDAARHLPACKFGAHLYSVLV